MKTIELKTNLHELIDSFQNTELLESVLEFLTENKNATPGGLWESLTAEQKGEVLDAYKESESEDNLTPHSEVLKEIG